MTWDCIAFYLIEARILMSFPLRPRCSRSAAVSLVLFAYVVRSLGAEETSIKTEAAAATPEAPSLSSLVQQAAKRLPAGGVVAAEITPTSIAYVSAGVVIPETGVAPENVLFEIGSITKVFTGLLLAHAVIEERVALSDPISTYLPSDLEMRPAVAAITLQQLATHTSGLPALPTNFAPASAADPYADYTVEQLYAFLRSYDPAAPGPQAHSYSNVGFGLLGHLLTRRYERSWAQLVQDKITGPLGMNDTVVELDAVRQSRFAVPYSGTQSVSPWHLPTLAGAGALRSTAADMSRFAQALLTGQPESLKAAWDLARQPRATLGGQAGSVGLGIMMGGRDSTRFYNHGGGTGGFRAHLEIGPGARAIVVLANNDSIEPGGMAAARLRPRPVTTAPVREEQAISVEKLAEFTGVYAVDGNRRFTAVIDDLGKLRMRLTGQPFLPIFFAGADRFFARAVAAEFQFARDAAGHIVSLTLHQNGNELLARRTADAPPKIVFLSPEKLSDYVGRYQLGPGLLFEIAPRGGTLTAKLTGQPAFPVHNLAPDHFVYDVVVAALTFERGTDGRVTGLILHQNGDHRAPRLPEQTK
jgi:D-alanyl-D-alanine-carboxypeptidase/D-alanyl-D-alanine-endopeptidase